MTDPTPLSPAAQAVLDALEEWISSDFVRYELRKAAIVLRAAADQLAPVENELIDDCWYEKKNPVRDQLLAIATELEGAQ